jgi:hypothetical protein
MIVGIRIVFESLTVGHLQGWVGSQNSSPPGMLQPLKVSVSPPFAYILWHVRQQYICGELQKSVFLQK